MLLLSLVLLALCTAVTNIVRKVEGSPQRDALIYLAGGALLSSFALIGVTVSAQNHRVAPLLAVLVVCLMLLVFFGIGTARLASSTRRQLA